MKREELTYEAVGEFFHSINRATDHEFTLKMYKNVTSWMCAYKKRLENPVNMRTGEPLSESGIKKLRTDLARTRRTMRDLRGAIKLQVLFGWVGAGCKINQVDEAFSQMWEMRLNGKEG